jgi:hypothetical protein
LQRRLLWQIVHVVVVKMVHGLIVVEDVWPIFLWRRLQHILSSMKK